MGFLTIIVSGTAVSQTADVKHVHRSNTFLPLGQADRMSIPSACPFATGNDTFHTMGSLFVHLSGRVIVTHSQRIYSKEYDRHPHSTFSSSFLPPIYLFFLITPTVRHQIQANLTCSTGCLLLLFSSLQFCQVS